MEKVLYLEGETSVILDGKTGTIAIRHDGMSAVLFIDGKLMVSLAGCGDSGVSFKKKTGTEGELNGELEICKHIHPHGWVACALIPKMV
jgi:hypothetical protein